MKSLYKLFQQLTIVLLSAAIGQSPALADKMTWWVIPPHTDNFDLLLEMAIANGYPLRVSGQGYVEVGIPPGRRLVRAFTKSEPLANLRTTEWNDPEVWLRNQKRVLFGAGANKAVLLARGSRANPNVSVGYVMAGDLLNQFPDLHRTIDPALIHDVDGEIIFRNRFRPSVGLTDMQWPAPDPAHWLGTPMNLSEMVPADSQALALSPRAVQTKPLSLTNRANLESYKEGTFLEEWLESRELIEANARNLESPVKTSRDRLFVFDARANSGWGQWFRHSSRMGIMPYPSPMAIQAAIGTGRLLRFGSLTMLRATPHIGIDLLFAWADYETSRPTVIEYAGEFKRMTGSMAAERARLHPIKNLSGNLLLENEICNIPGPYWGCLMKGGTIINGQTVIPMSDPRHPVSRLK